MAKVLSIDEMLQVFIDNKWHNGPLFGRMLEMIANEMARVIAENLFIKAGEAETAVINVGEAETPVERVFVAFSPASEGQPCPPEIIHYDPESDWGADATDEVEF